ncbi:hypothetical protein SAY86_005060 [Trapa natans]|uniref:Integrator complex subunit 4 n=1 Tax=Trapa natans TaxID=22666 RepID=A0AAN7QS48_TRANT|nr:hypothetical protein SAY86_005060 [Trapa natans]
MLEGFTKDPYPCVRKAALDGLISLSRAGAVEGHSLITRCHHGAVELLGDSEACVRVPAIQTICSMDSDMSVEVRVAAFDAIGKTKMVSVEFLLQTLSKKVLDAMEEDNYLGQGSREQREDSASSGSLVHGLEDEYHELHALETMQLMANRGHLYSLFESSACAHGEMIAKLHLDTDMFLGPLTDSSSLIRDAVRKVLKSMKLKNMELFRLSVYGLVESMKSYHQIEPASDGKLGFDGAPVSAFLLLAIAAPLCHVKNRCKIPVSIFSYDVTMLGRISSALVDEANQYTPLPYLSHYSRGSTDHVTDSKEIPSVANFSVWIFADSEKNEVSKIDMQKMHSGNLLPSYAKKKGFFSKFRMLTFLLFEEHFRACKGELAMLASEPSGISATVALTEQYPREIAFQVKLLQPEICCYEITMRKSSAVLFQIEHLQEEAYMKPSSFVTELEKATVNTVSSITPDEGTQSFLSWEIRAELTVPAYQGGRKLWLK